MDEAVTYIATLWPPTVPYRYYYHSALQWYQYLLLNLKQEDALAACQWS